MGKTKGIFTLNRGRVLLLVAGLCLAGTAAAHTGGMAGHGFSAGFSHPIFGLDHLFAMLAVGMWGAFLGAPAIWALPVTFPLVMAFGAVLGRVAVWRGPALQPPRKINHGVPDKARGAGPGHSRVKPRNAVWHDFGLQRGAAPNGNRP